MKGISSYELVLIFGLVIILVGGYSIASMKHITDTYIVSKSKVIGDYLGSKAITSSHCYLSKVDHIEFDDKNKIITVYMRSIYSKGGFCNVDKSEFSKLLNRSDYQIKIV